MEELTRTCALLGEDNVKKLKDKRIIIFGIGGVGGYTCEALARTGVGKIDIVEELEQEILDEGYIDWLGDDSHIRI